MGKGVELPFVRQFPTLGTPRGPASVLVVSLQHNIQVGETLFALATGEKKADVNLVGAYGAEAMSAAILCAVREAKSAGGLLAWRDLQPSPG